MQESKKFLHFNKCQFTLNVIIMAYKPLERLHLALNAIKKDGKPIKQKEVAQDLGYSREGTVSEILNGKRLITPKFQKAFCATYGISEEWLLTGEGNMFNAVSDTDSISQTKSAANNNSNTEVSEPENVDYPTIGGRRKSVPLFDTEASAGQGNSIDLAPVTTPTQYIELGDLLRSDSQAALYIFGNSMTPSYPSGCIVGLRQNNDGIIQPGEVYVIEIESNRLLKRLYYNDDNTAYVLYSDNTMQFETGPRKGHYMYPPFEVKFDSVRRLFDVTGVIKRNRNSAILQRA